MRRSCWWVKRGVPLFTRSPDVGYGKAWTSRWTVWTVHTSAQIGSGDALHPLGERGGAGADPIEGRDAVIRDFFEPLRDAPIRIETYDALANDEHLVSIGTLHIELGGETKSLRFTEVCHTRDGRISERWVLAEDQYGLDETLGQLAGA